MKYLPLIIIAFVALTGCTPNRESDYTSITVYERQENWIFPDKYIETTVAIPIQDRVPPAFCLLKKYYVKTGEKYVETEMKVVFIEAYEESKRRRQELINNIYNFFRVLAVVGIVMVVAGIILFVVTKKFPFLPDVWDELLLYGGVAGSIGVAGAWYAEEIVKVGIAATVIIFIAMGYSIFKQHKTKKNKVNQSRELEAKGQVITELVGTVETYKDKARGVWSEVKAEVRHSELTQETVKSLKPIIVRKRQESKACIPVP